MLLRLLSPNLTMNLTYLCYGSSKVGQGLLCVKAFRPTPSNLVEIHHRGERIIKPKEKEYNSWRKPTAK